MANAHVAERLSGIQTMLKGVHQSNASLSSATKGRERAEFIDEFLSKVLPAPYRFGTGDATDLDGNRTGQLDVVVEYPFMPSLPLVGGGATRLYLAESVAAVVEVKSNLAGQWEEVLGTAGKLHLLRRQFQTEMYIGSPPSERIPFFVAGYEGWKTVETAREKLGDAAIAGILVVDPGVFVSSHELGDIQAEGPWALWGLISCLRAATNTPKMIGRDPMSYAR